MVSGVKGVDTTVGVVNGYQLPLIESGYQPHNSYFESQWAAIIADVRVFSGGIPNEQYYGGWSAGGGTVFAGMAGPIFDGEDNVSRTVHTFGSPKPWGTDLQTRAEGRCKIARWMNDDDPIPIVPPTALDAPLSVAVTGIRAAFAAGYYVQPHGGLLLNSIGNISPGVLPFNVVTGFTSSLVNWYFEWEKGGDPAHLITTYANRLQQWLDRNARLRERHFVGGIAEVPLALARGQITRAQQEAARTVVNLERRQNLKPVKVKKETLFSAIRVARVWYVLFGNTVVALGGTKKGSRRLAQTGNDFLRSLQNRPAVDVGSLETELKNYLDTATTDAADFVPLMNTVFPS